MQSYSAEGRTEEGQLLTSSPLAEEWRSALATRGLALIGLYCSTATPTTTSTLATTSINSVTSSSSPSPGPSAGASSSLSPGASPGAGAGAGAVGYNNYNNRIVDRPRRHLLKTTHFNRYPSNPNPYPLSYA